jgi:hypothetical protein
VIKSALALEIAVASFVGALSTTDWAAKITLYAAALAGLGWFYVNVLRPLVRLIKRTVDAVDAFEGLPDFQVKTEVRTRVLEGRSAELHNGQQAIIRELGIEDHVRKIDPRMYGVEDLWESPVRSAVPPKP